MKVLFYPSDYSTNKYGSIITEGLSSRSIEVVTYSSAFKSYNVFKSIDVVHLNWFESLGKSTSADIKKFIARSAKLIAFKLSGKRIVWTMHNKISHDQKNRSLKKAFMRLIISSADVIIIHSKISEQILQEAYHTSKSKIKYIPHPDYIDAYKAPVPIAVQPLSQGRLNLLFLGAVKPYKNIELLINMARQFPDKVTLTIAGNAKENYKAQVIEYARGTSNVNFILQFIPDDMLTTYIRDSDLLILPYNLKSSLNSGTVILAFSNARTVICPAIGTISDLEDPDTVLSYTYTDDEQHAGILLNKVQQAIAMKEADPSIFKKLGAKVFEQVSLYNSKDSVTDKLINQYQSPRS